MSTSQFDYVDDAGEFVSDLIGVKEISSEILKWLNQNEFCVFHGTRLLPKELESIKAIGLQPLVADERHERLKKILSNHPDWHLVKENLTQILKVVGPGFAQGKREGEVHFSLSKSGLTNGFNHYIEYGSEFDQHVAYRLFNNDSGYEFLKMATTPYVVFVRMGGEELVKGTHASFSYQDIREQGEIPGLGKTFLDTWAFKCSKPEFDLEKLKTDCCMKQAHTTLPKNILKIEKRTEF